MRQRAIEEQETAWKLVGDCNRRQQDCQRGLEEFLALSGTSDPEEFWRRAGDHSFRLELEWRRQKLKRALERLGGPRERFDAFRERLAAADRLNEESVRTDEALQEIEAQRSNFLEEWGRMDSELEHLTWAGSPRLWHTCAR